MTLSSKMSLEKELSQSVDVQARGEEAVRDTCSSTVLVSGRCAGTVAPTAMSCSLPVEVQNSKRQVVNAQVPVILSETVAKAAFDQKYSEENSIPSSMLPQDLVSSSDGSSSPSDESVVCRESNSAPSVCLLKGHSSSKLEKNLNQEAKFNSRSEKASNAEIKPDDQKISDAKCNGVHLSQGKTVSDDNKRELCEPLESSSCDTRGSCSVPTSGRLPDEDSSQPALNPFVHRIHFRFPYDYIKVALLTIFIVPIRVFFIASSIVLAYIVSSIGLYGLTPDKLTEKPFSGWKRPLRWLMGFSGRLMMRSYGFHILSVKGIQASVADAPVLVAAPHSSFFDGLACYWSKVPGLVSRFENSYIPCFGKFISFTQPVFVWRDDSNSRHQTVNEIKKRVAGNQGWPQMMLFPEGTCTNRSCLITFKAGAFYPGVPVQPVVIRYFNSMDTTTWTWDGPGALKLIWLTMAQFHNFAELEYLPVYYPNEEEKNDAHLYASNVRAVMAKALGVPVVDYSYDDCRVMNQAKLNKLPPHIGLIEFQKLRRSFGFTLKEVEVCMSSQFAQMANKDGVLRLSGLARYLHLPHSEPTLVHLFNLLDSSNSGEVTFRQYLLGYWEIVKPVVTEELVQHTFSLLDAEGEGQVSLGGITEALDSIFELTPEESALIFNEIDTNENNCVTKDDFHAFCQHKGEYVWLLLRYQESVRSGARKGSGYKRTLDVPFKTKSE